MQLYTVKLAQKTIISSFDAKGRKVGEREEKVVVTFTDLPWQTAQMYRQKAGDENVEVITQAPTYGDGKGSTSSRKTRVASASAAGGKSQAQPQADPNAAIKNAARTGDMAGAISQGA